MIEKWDLTPSEDSWKPAGTDPRASSTGFSSGREQQPYRMAMWRAVPGRYERPKGMPWSETFVVYTGTGSIECAEGRIDLKPGTIVNLRVGEPYVLTITQALEKMAVITDPPRKEAGGISPQEIRKS